MVVVDRDADAWQPRLAELQAELFAQNGGGGQAQSAPAVRLEVLDRATVQALERLEAAGLVHSRVRATRHLHPAGATTATPLSDEEKARAAEFRRQAAEKLKLARILLAEEMADEAADALREAARLAGGAFAVEECVPKTPATLTAALAPPLSRRWGEAAEKLRTLVEAGSMANAEAIDALSRVIAQAHEIRSTSAGRNPSWRSRSENRALKIRHGADTRVSRLWRPDTATMRARAGARVGARGR